MAQRSIVKLLFIDASRGIGGTEHHAVALTCAMRDIGHDVRALIRDGTWLAGAFENAGIATEAIVFRGGFDPRLMKRLYAAIRDFRPDWLISNDSRLYWPLVVVGRSTGVRVALFRHLASISKAVTRRWIPRLADRFFVVSNYQRAKLARDGALATHLKVLYNPIDLARFCPSAECRNAFRNRIDSSSHDIIVGFAGRLAPEKGIFVLEQALTLAMRRVARLRAVWIGEGPALERLSGKIQASAYARRHALLSYESDLSAVLPGLDLLAVPSLSLETFGRISAEAQACGVPVVCSDSGGLAETLRPGTSGHLVPAGDAYALAQQILALTCNDALRSEMGRQAHRHAGRFCALRVARMFEAALPDADFVPAPPALHAERHEITQRP
ncbi:MAG: glycosyltransferase family 4 protein [Burkholderiales bacterium]